VTYEEVCHHDAERLGRRQREARAVGRHVALQQFVQAEQLGEMVDDGQGTDQLARQLVGTVHPTSLSYTLVITYRLIL